MLSLWLPGIFEGWDYVTNKCPGSNREGDQVSQMNLQPQLQHKFFQGQLMTLIPQRSSHWGYPGESVTQRFNRVMVLMVGFMFSQQPWKTDVMLPITHMGAARGHRESSRTQLLCSHPDLVEKAQCPETVEQKNVKQQPKPSPCSLSRDGSWSGPLTRCPTGCCTSAETEAPTALRGSSSSEHPNLLSHLLHFSHRNPSREEEKKNQKKRKRNREQDRPISSISCIIHRKNPRSGEELNVKAGFTTCTGSSSCWGMLCDSTGNNTRSPTTGHTKFHRSFPCRNGW